jgi:hypothetical protein
MEDKFVAFEKSKKLFCVMWVCMGLSACGDTSSPDSPDDITAPVLSILGDANIEIEVGSTYTDEGATAVDDVDGNISANIVISGSVDTSTLGVYTLTYTVSDSSGNSATSLTRTIVVVDTTAPQLSLVGETNITLEKGTNYTESGATATDNVDGDISASIVTTGSVNTELVGTYTINYKVLDSSSNESSLDRIVKVVDTTAPLLLSTIPSDAESDLAIDIAISATFNEPILASSVSESTVLLEDQDGNKLSGAVSLDSSNLVISFVPANALSEGTQYFVTLKQSISDLEMNTLVSDLVWGFSTLSTETSELPELINIQNNPADEPQMAMNASGVAVAAWRQDHFININSFDPVNGWQGVEQVSLVAADGTTPLRDMKVAINDSGSAIVVWTETDIGGGAGASSVYANRFTIQSGWSGAELVDEFPSGISEQAQVDIDASGNSIVVWRHRESFGADAGIYSRRYDASNSTWEPADTVYSEDPAINDNAESPYIALNAGGKGMVVWVLQSSEIMARYFDPAARWSSMSSIADNPNVDIVLYPQVSIDNNEMAVAVWMQRLSSNTHPDIYSSQYSLANGWDSSVALETNQFGEARFPQITMNDSHAVAVWTEYDGSTHSLFSNVLTTGGSWEGITLLESSDFSVFQNSDGGVSIALTPSGKAMVAWNQGLRIPETSAVEFRISISERQLVSDPTWASPTVLIQEALTTEAFMPIVGLADDGDAVVISQRLESNSLDIQSHRID